MLNAKQLANHSSLQDHIQHEIMLHAADSRATNALCASLFPAEVFPGHITEQPSRQVIRI